MVEVVDLTKEVLKEFDVCPLFLPMYRAFTNQLIKLISKGYVVIKATKVKGESLKNLSSLNVKWRYVRDENGKEVSRWSIVRDVEVLKEFYSLYYGLRDDILNRIVERLNEYDVVVVT